MQEIEAIKANVGDEYCFLICRSASGSDVDVRLPVAQALKLYDLLKRRFNGSGPLPPA